MSTSEGMRRWLSEVSRGAWIVTRWASTGNVSWACHRCGEHAFLDYREAPAEFMGRFKGCRCDRAVQDERAWREHFGLLCLQAEPA